MLQDRSKQIDDQLKQLSAEEQDKLLAGLPEAELRAYANFAARNVQTPINPKQQPLREGFTVVRGDAPQAAPPREPTEDEISQMTDAQLEQLAKGDSLNTAEILGPEKPGGWLDNTAGMTARAAMKGAVALPGLIADHTILPAIDAITGDEQGVADVGTQGLVDSLADLSGMKTPKTAGQRVYSDVVSGVAGVPTGMAAGKVLTFLPKGGTGFLGKASTGLSRFGGMMTQEPVKQAISAGLGSYAAGNVREGGGGTVEQLAAALAAGSIPQIASGVKNAVVRGAMRGGPSGRAAMLENMENFDAAGAQPTVADATGGDKAKATEAFLSRLFGSSSVMQKAGRAQEEGVGDRISELVDALSPGATPTGAGAKIVEGYENTFLPQAKEIVGRGYRVLDKILPKDTIVPATNFEGFLRGKTTATQGAERLTTDSTIRPSMRNWGSTLRNLQADMRKNGGISYQGLRESRSYIGDQLADTLFADTKKVPIKELRGAYAALTEDMRAAARSAGAEAAFDKANATAKQFYDHLELIEPIVDKAGGAEKIFRATISGLDDGATRLTGIYNTIPEGGRKYLSAAIIRRMARENPNTDEFSLQEFFRNYNKLSPEAKTQIFGRVGTDFEKNFQRIAKVAKTIREGRDDFGVATSPKEGRNGLQMLMYPLMFTAAGGVTGAAGSGGSALAAGAGALAGATTVLGGSRLLAKWMTNPKAVEFLAQTTKVPPSQVPQMLNQLVQQARRESDPDLEEFAEYLKTQSEGKEK